jgi:hypothetical protein
VINWLREWRHFVFCGAGREWLPRGRDAVCSQCGYRVKGGGPEARLSQALRESRREYIAPGQTCPPLGPNDEVRGDVFCRRWVERRP